MIAILTGMSYLIVDLICMSLKINDTELLKTMVIHFPRRPLKGQFSKITQINGNDTSRALLSVCVHLVI